MRNKIGVLVLSALAYMVAGKVGGLLSVPPGFASAVWPASGVALALAIRFPLLPIAMGAALGNFIINLSFSSENFAQVTSQGLFAAGAIGVAAALQLCVGRGLFNWVVHKSKALVSPQSIMGFVFLVALGGCIVSASLSTLSLWVLGITPSDIVLFTWLTWWVGDSLGVLFFTPFMLALLAPKSAISLRQKLQVILPSMLIFSCTWMLFSTSQSWQTKARTLAVENESLDIYRYIFERLQNSGDVLSAYDAFISTETNFNLTRFNQFSEVMLNSAQSLYAVGWTEIIPHHRRVEVEQSFRDMGYRNFQFTQLTPDGDVVTAQRQTEYYPVLYIYPLSNNHRAFGLNLAANPERQEALYKAKALAKPVATAPIVLAQELGNQKAIILYRPIFNRDQTEFKGYVSGVMRVNGMIGKAFELLEQRGFSLILSDVTTGHLKADLIRQEDPPLAGVPRFTYSAEFGERKYQIELYANTNHHTPSRNWASWAVLTGGFLIAALTQMFVMSVIGSHTRIRDEVERKTLDLQKQTALAEQANKAKSEFLSNMSHELRTPLNAIIGLVNLCQKTDLTKQQSHYLHKASLASSTLLSLINQTLDHAKIEAGKMEVNADAFSISHVMNKLYAVFEQSALDKNIEFLIQTEGEIIDQVVGDELRLEQILINLLGNAFKFTQEGSVTLTIADGQDGGYKFDVNDTGCGIPEHYQQELFTAFSQVDSSTSRIFGGTGLGLSISSNLAAMMGGRLHLIASSGAGSTFRLQLPLRQAETGACVQLALTATGTPTTTETMDTAAPPVTIETDIAGEQGTMLTDQESDKPLAHCNILLVEDIAINQMVAEGILSDFGATVVIANNGQEALDQLAQRQDLNLVLMDVQMPIMDGYEATRRIRQQAQYDHLPILAMTANAMAQDIAQCKAAGMNEHIAKPIDAAILLSKILAFTQGPNVDSVAI